MTMPHLMNCDHSDDGWCLECVHRLWDECDDAKQRLIQRNRELIEACICLMAAEEWHAGRISDDELHSQMAVARREKDATFVEYLQKASRIVSGWPEWKRNLLGGVPQ